MTASVYLMSGSIRRSADFSTSFKVSFSGGDLGKGGQQSSSPMDLYYVMWPRL